MSDLQDKFDILNNIKVNGNINNIKNFIQNLMNDNIIFHPFLLNNILKDNIDNVLLSNELSNIFNTYNRSKRQHFRNLLKKGELSDIIINNYLYEYINIVRNINSYLNSSSLSINTFDKTYKWGNSLITINAIISFVDIIINDKIIDSIINKSINTNNNMYSFINNIKDMSVYIFNNNFL